MTLAPHTVAPGDMLIGAAEIAAYLTTLGGTWTCRMVRHARESGGLPIRKSRAIGLYALRSELLAALTAPETLPAGLTTRVA